MKRRDGVSHWLRLYPARLRAEYEGQIAEYLACERTEERYRGFLGAVRFSLHAGLDVVKAHIDAPEQLRVPEPPTRARISFRQRLGDFGRDVGYALRSLLRAPAFTATVVLTLALGVGVNGAVFSLVDRVFLRAPAGVVEPESVHRIYGWLPVIADSRTQPFVHPDFNAAQVDSIRAAIASLHPLAAWTATALDTLERDGGELEAYASWVSQDYFPTLGVVSARGRFFSDGEGKHSESPVAVLGHAFWERAFASDPNVLGKTLVADSVTYTIVGVAQAGFSGLDYDGTDVFFGLDERLIPAEWRSAQIRVAARTSSPAGVQQLERLAAQGLRGVELERAAGLQARAPQAAANAREQGAGLRVFAGSIVSARGVGDRAPDAKRAWLSAGSESVVRRIGWVSLALLLIACANAACLLLVRTSRRQNEIAIRLALGISRKRLHGQFLIEGMLLAALAGAGALLVGWIGGAALSRLLMPEVRWTGGVLHERVIAVILCTSVAVGLVAGITPSLQTQVGRLAISLRSRREDGARREPRLRAGLLVLQAALSVILLASAGLFVRSLVKIAEFLEYDVDQVAWVYASPTTLPTGKVDPAALRSLGTLLAEQPGVNGIALASMPPMGGGYGSGIVNLPNGDSLPELSRSTRFYRVSGDFFEVTGRRVVRGRSLLDDETDAIVMNEFASQTYFPGGDALGQCLPTYSIDAQCARVVGIVADAPWSQITDKPTLQFYLPLTEKAPPRAIVLRVDRRVWPHIAEMARAELEPAYGEGAFEIRRMADRLDVQLRPWRVGSQLFSVFGLLAVLVTLVGVYSVTSFVVAQRTHEIGIRIALGARLSDVLREVLRGGVFVLSLGALIGLGVVVMLNKVLTPLLYGVDARDPVVMAAAVTTLVIAGVAANLVPAWRAARVDPVKALAVE
jgi:putative ABC transport system permease protein